MASEIVTRELSCVLTSDELVQRGALMADKELAIEREKGKRSKVTKKINVLCKERFDLATAIECGEEIREVRCEWQDDFAQNLKRLIRIDTGDEVEQVAMTADDRQLAMESPPASRQVDDTIDLDDVPDDDDDPDDDEDAADDEREIDDQRVPVPAPEPKRKARSRARQQQPVA